jgi:hypothetical protein
MARWSLKYVRWTIAAALVFFAFYKEEPALATVAFLVLLWGK